MVHKTSPVGGLHPHIRTLGDSYPYPNHLSSDVAVRFQTNPNHLLKMGRFSEQGTTIT